MANDDTIASRYIAHGLALIRAANGMARDVDAELVKLGRDIRYLLSQDEISNIGRRALNALLSDINDAIFQRYNAVTDMQSGDLAHLIEIESAFAVKAGDYNNKPSDTALAGILPGLLILGSSLRDYWRKLATDFAYRVAAAVKTARRAGASNAAVVGNKAAITTIFGPKRADGQPSGDIGAARRAATALVHTGTQAASQDARLAAFKANGVKFFEWHAVLDAHVCPICAMRSGKLWTIDGAPVGHDVPFISPPAHPWCLTGDTLVTPRGRVTAVSERRYEGNLVVIRTASGNKLSCTQNHPILTDSGWVAAGLLDVGSNVVSDGRGNGGAVSETDGEHVPTPIEEIARAFSESRGVAAREVPISPEDFHGDGIGSDVAVVWADSELWNGENPPVEQHVGKVDFANRSGAHPAHASLGAAHLLDERSLGSSDRVVAGGSLGLAFLRRHARGAQQVRFGVTAGDDSRLNQSSVDDEPSYGVGGGECVHRFTGEVSTDDLCVGKFVAHPVLGAAGSAERAVERSGGDASLANHILGGHAGPVFLDRVIDKSAIQFAGHVYNLETTEHWYIANGIINHNCRCINLPHSGDPPADGGANILQFNEWLLSLTDEQENELLGVGRADLYRRGVITLNDLINQNGRLMSLAELKASL